MNNYFNLLASASPNTKEIIEILKSWGYEVEEKHNEKFEIFYKISWTNGNENN